MFLIVVLTVFVFVSNVSFRVKLHRSSIFTITESDEFYAFLLKCNDYSLCVHNTVSEHLNKFTGKNMDQHRGVCESEVFDEVRHNDNTTPVTSISNCQMSLENEENVDDVSVHGAHRTTTDSLCNFLANDQAASTASKIIVFGNRLASCSGNLPPITSVDEADVHHDDDDNSRSWSIAEPESIEVLTIDEFDRRFPSNRHHKYSTKSILLNDVRGKMILKSYERSQKFDESQLLLLIDVILDYHFSENMNKFSNAEIDKISDRICEEFPNLDKKCFYIPSLNGSAPSGMLFQRYNNKLKKFRRQGLIPTSVRTDNKRKRMDLEDELDNMEADDELMAHVSKIKAYGHAENDMELDEITFVWGSLFEYRMKKLQLEKRQRSKDVISEWPVLNHPDAYTLINLDFQRKYDGDTSAALINGWAKVFAKPKILFNLLKDKNCLKMLKTVGQLTDDNIKHAAYSLALHGLFKPTQRSAGDGSTFKPSIVDLQDSFLLITTLDEVDAAIKERERKCAAKGFYGHPFFVGICKIKTNATRWINRKFTYFVWDVDEIESIRVVFDSAVYQCNDFLSAVDICFKIYSIFQIPYPESKNVWIFFDQSIYKTTVATTSKIAFMLQDLK